MQAADFQDSNAGDAAQSEDQEAARGGSEQAGEGQHEGEGEEGEWVEGEGEPERVQTFPVDIIDEEEVMILVPLVLCWGERTVFIRLEEKCTELNFSREFEQNSVGGSPNNHLAVFAVP